MTPLANLRERLAADPARGLGCANQVAQEAINHPAVLHDLVAALRDTRPLVVARAANALKKVQARDPRALDTFAHTLVRLALACEVLEARWNLCVILGGLRLQGDDRALTLEWLFGSLTDKSALLRTCAMQALADLSHDDALLQKRIRPVLESALILGTAAMRARARRLLASHGKVTR